MNHPTTRSSRGAFVALVLALVPPASAAALGALALTAGLSGCSKPAAETTRVYSSKGVIKSFGPDRKFANIAHEKIPDYMDAMTMSFEPTSPAQLEGLAAGDKVTFSFKAQDGKHLLTAIAKEK
jgi:Cu(I)/Ag(I) efflux system protein CusF